MGATAVAKGGVEDGTTRVSVLAVPLALITLTGAGLALRLREAWQSMPVLVVDTLPDDAFYYFQIARNIMHGEGATLDGETLTNGFHPLWMALILPFFALDDRVLSVHLALTLGAAMGAATIPITFDVVRRLTQNPRASLLAAGFVGLHPVLVTYGVNGLETSVTLLLIAVVSWLFIREVGDVEERSTSRDLVLGLACGLLVLSRIDAALVVVPLAIYLLGTERRRPRWRGPATMLATVFMTVLPWAAWNLAMFRTVVQDSAVAGDAVQRDAYLAAHRDSIGTRIDHGVDVARQTFVDILPTQFMVPLGESTTTFWLVVAVLAVAVVVIPTKHRGQTLTALGLIAVPFSGLVLALVYEAGIRWFVRLWYYAPYAAFAAVCVGIVANWLEGIVSDALAWLDARAGAAGPRSNLVPGAALVVLYIALVGALLYRYGPQRDDGLVFRYGWQAEVLAATEWVSANTEPDARAAAYNAGIPSYLSGRTVVNLDGVVNRDAFNAGRDCTMQDYLAERDIGYVVEAVGQFLLTPCGLTLEEDLAEITRFGGFSPVVVAKVRPPDP